MITVKKEGTAKFVIKCQVCLFANVVVLVYVTEQGKEEGGKVKEKVKDAPEELQQCQEVSEHYSVSERQHVGIVYRPEHILIVLQKYCYPSWLHLVKAY